MEAMLVEEELIERCDMLSKLSEDASHEKLRKGWIEAVRSTVTTITGTAFALMNRDDRCPLQERFTQWQMEHEAIFHSKGESP